MSSELTRRSVFVHFFKQATAAKPMYVTFDATCESVTVPRSYRGKRSVEVKAHAGNVLRCGSVGLHLRLSHLEGCALPWQAVQALRSSDGVVVSWPEGAPEPVQGPLAKRLLYRGGLQKRPAYLWLVK